jgi:outer membrane protein assembly factor BamB
MKASSLFLIFVTFANASAFGEASWSQWRGPGGLGHATATGLPTSWSETENVTWKTDLPGKGWSSPVIEDGRIWMTTGIDRAASEEEKEERLRSNTGNQPLVVSDFVKLHAVCVDLKTGKLLHDIEVLTENDPQWIHTQNSYASPTPVIEKGRLYCHYGTYGTACLDTQSGRVLWTNRNHRIMHENGPGGSPVLWRDLLIFHCDGSDKQYIVALDKNTGKEVWSRKRSGKMNANPQLKKSYATPLIAEFGGTTHLLSPAADWLYGYDLATGQELWKLNYGVLGFSNVARPVLGNDSIYLSTGFMRPEMIAVRPASHDGALAPQIVWRYKKQVPTLPSPLLVGQRIYFVSNQGVATCLDANNGKELWANRLGGNFAASPMYADDKIYFPNREGLTFVIKPGPQFQLLATNQLDSGFMASPAAVDGALILRTETSLYRIEDKGR